jgi:chromosome segregation ATPase
MATHLAELEVLKCPLCGAKLTNEEYQNVKQQLKKQLDQERKKEIEQEHEIEKMSIRNRFTQEICNKKTQISELKRQAEENEIEAKARADASARAEIDELQRGVSERDIQLRRLGKEIGELKKQASRTQPELKGLAGEENLLAILRNEFRQDLFMTQRRGTSGADIIQQIRSASDELLKITIGYDNKEANDVNKSDIEKAKRDRDDQGIDYMIIVSRSFSKKDVKNGFLGNSEGVLLVHPDILVDLVRSIRTMIVKMSKISESMRDQDDKQEELYKYVTSEKFCRSFEKILEVHTKLSDLQSKEEKSHKSLWSTRKQLGDDLIDTYYNMSSEIERITQTPQSNDLPITNLEMADESDGNGKAHHTTNL